MLHKIKIYLLILLAVMGFAACKYDNFTPPSVKLTGQLMYNGQPFLFDGRPDGGSDIVQLSQYGFGKSGGFTTAQVQADGSFQQLVFPGAYHITMKNTPYPFVLADWPKNAGNQYDTMHVNISGDYNLKVNVIPYFEITNVTGKVVGTDYVISFKVNQVRPGAKLMKARAYANTAEIVNSSVRMSAEKDIQGVDISQPIEIKFSIIDYRSKFPNNTRDFMHYRVALETDISNTYFLWSATQKATGLPQSFTDVTSTYLKNFKQPYATSPGPAWWDQGRRKLVNDWLYSAPMEETMFDGWGDRMAMSAENWGWRPPGLTGGIWQTVTMPAGKYVLIAERGPSYLKGDLQGGKNRAYVAIASGATLAWNSPNILHKADLGEPANGDVITIPFDLAASTQVSIGYVVNFPGNELNAIFFTSWKLIKAD